MLRTFSTPTNYESSLPLDHPMKLSDVHVAARDALKDTVSDADLWKSLSSVEHFEVRFPDLLIPLNI